MQSKLTNIDLNLLVALQVLIEEKNVTRAADRLFITQPAMSKTLQRLRNLFDDPLFTRTAHGLVATPKINEIKQPLIKALEHLESTIFMEDFDPAEATGGIAITAPEFIAVGIVPELVKRFQQHAPTLQLQSRNLLDDEMEQLANGSLDFSIHLNQDYGDDVSVFPLITSSPVLWMRCGHPLSRKRNVRKKDFRIYPHVELHLPNINDTDVKRNVKMLEESGILKNPILKTSQLGTAMEVLTHSDAIVIGPDYLDKLSVTEGHIISKTLNEIDGIEIFEVTISLLQHHRTLNSQLHTWVRDLIIGICNIAN